MNFYALKSKLEVIATAIQEKAQPYQFFTLQRTGSNSTVVEHFEVGWFYSNTILNDTSTFGGFDGTSAF